MLVTGGVAVWLLVLYSQLRIKFVRFTDKTNHMLDVLEFCNSLIVQITKQNK
jgi:hypothetical protein